MLQNGLSNVTGMLIFFKGRRRLHDLVAELSKFKY